MNKFEQAVADVLEVEEVSLETRFREVDGWCSLKAFGLLVMMENDWQAPVTIEQFQGFTCVRDLYREAFTAFAARLFGVPRAQLDGASYGSLGAWDSINHLRLVMESEARFGVKYALERIPSLRTIEDFL